jgi:hypothetical protein
MEPFFIETEFYPEVEDFISAMEWEDEDVKALPDNWEQEIFPAKLEKVVTLKSDFLADEVLERLFIYYEDRFPEDDEKVVARIKDAIRHSIDIYKLNSLIPELYYPEGSKSKLTKQDLLDSI